MHIYVSDEAGEPGRPTSVLTRRIKQAVGEWYVLELVEETRRGMEENTRQGYNTGGIAPFGYRKRFEQHPSRTMAERGKHKVILEPHPEQAPVVERIFSEFVFGNATLKGIRDDLNRDGAPSPRGGSWHVSGITGILENPEYTGFQVWNRRRRKTANGARNPESEWVWSPEPAHEPIVTVDVWRKAQELRRDQGVDWRSRRRSGDTQRPLRGLLFCPCGRRMVPVHRARVRVPTRWYWECPVCRHRVGDEAVQGRVTDVVCRELLDPERLATLAAREQEAAKTKKAKSSQASARLEKRIAAVQDKIRAQLKGLEAGIDPRLVKEIVDELQVEEQALRAKLEALRSDQELANVAALTELARHAPGLRDALQNGGPEHQRKVLVRIVRAVHWVPDHERLEIRMGVPAGGGGSAPDGGGQNPCGLRR